MKIHKHEIAKIHRYINKIKISLKLNYLLNNSAWCLQESSQCYFTQAIPKARLFKQKIRFICELYNILQNMIPDAKKHKKKK